MINNNLKVFIKAAENLSITETARELYISQPAVSNAIKSLEKKLSLKLFHRDKRAGLHLTDGGEKILHLARQVEDIENRIYQTSFRENNFMGGRVRIASMPIISSVILAPVIYRFRQKYPFVKIELTEGTALEIRNAVTEHRVDFGITSSPFENLDFEVLMQDGMFAVSSTAFETEVFDLYNSSEELIFCRAGHEMAMEILKKQNINFEKRFIVQQAETVIRLVENHNGIGVISGLVLSNNANSLYTIPVNPKIKIDIGIVSTNLDDLTPPAIEMKRMIKEQVQSL